jgi:hypothetical protein
MIEIIALIAFFVVVPIIGVALGLRPAEEPPVEDRVQEPARPSTFFVRDASAEVQLEILLGRLEQHVRQERAAVESFHERPSAESLRCATTSPLN